MSPDLPVNAALVATKFAVMAKSRDLLMKAQSNKHDLDSLEMVPTRQMMSKTRRSPPQDGPPCAIGNHRLPTPKSFSAFDQPVAWVRVVVCSRRLFPSIFSQTLKIGRAHV